MTPCAAAWPIPNKAGLGPARFLRGKRTGAVWYGRAKTAFTHRAVVLLGG